MSTFLVVVIIVIGINLMNSYEKMKQFDKSINTLMNQMSGNDTDQSDNQDDTVTVNKLSGDVYPTKGDTDTSQNEDNMKMRITTVTQEAIPAAQKETPVVRIVRKV